MTLTALTRTVTVSPFFTPRDLSESSVKTELMVMGLSTLTWTRHMSPPFLMSVILPVIWLRALVFIRVSCMAQEIRETDGRVRMKSESGRLFFNDVDEDYDEDD